MGVHSLRWRLVDAPDSWGARFAGSTLRAERVLGLTKSLIAVKVA